MSYVRESLIERMLVKLCKLHDWACVKFVSPGLRGMPDRIVFKGIDDAVTFYAIWNGYSRKHAEEHVRAILALTIRFVELKAPGEKPTPQQLRRHRELRDLGFDVAVLDSQDAVEVWVENA